MWGIIGGLIPGLGQVLEILTSAKWFWKVLNNWGTIRKVLGDVESVVVSMLERKKPTPDCNDTKKLVDALQILFDSGLIDLPGVDEHNVARILMNIENNLNCSLPQGQGVQNAK